jgi:chromosome segregation ATPase
MAEPHTRKLTVEDQLRASELPVYIKDRETELEKLNTELEQATAKSAKQKQALKDEIAALTKERDRLSGEAKTALAAAQSAEAKRNAYTQAAGALPETEKRLADVQAEVKRLVEQASAVATEAQAAEERVGSLRQEEGRLTQAVAAAEQKLQALQAGAEPTLAKGLDPKYLEAKEAALSQREARTVGLLERVRTALTELGRRHGVLRAAELAVGRKPTETPRLDEAMKELTMTETPERPPGEEPPPPPPGKGEEEEDEDDGDDDATAGAKRRAAKKR